MMMLKLLSAIQFELDHLPVIGEIVKPARGRFRPYCWKTPKLRCTARLAGRCGRCASARA